MMFVRSLFVLSVVYRISTGKATYPTTANGNVYAKIGVHEHLRRPSTQVLRVGPVYLFEDLFTYVALWQWML